MISGAISGYSLQSSCFKKTGRIFTAIRAREPLNLGDFFELNDFNISKKVKS